MNDLTEKLSALADTQVAEPATDGFAIDAMSGSIGTRLRAAGVPLTLQRLAIAQVMLPAPVHVTADQVLSRVRGFMPDISRATVYNTLKLFGEKGLLREVIVGADNVVFDSTTTAHYHAYDVDTGEVTDLPPGAIEIVGSADLPFDPELDEIDVVVRVRRKKA